jgi:hypothetical protein
MKEKFWTIGLDGSRCLDPELGEFPMLAPEQFDAHGLDPSKLIYDDYATAENVANRIWDKTHWPLTLINERGRAVELWRIREEGKAGLITPR